MSLENDNCGVYDENEIEEVYTTLLTKIKENVKNQKELKEITFLLEKLVSAFKYTNSYLGTYY